MLISAFILSIVAITLFVLLMVIFLWVGIEANKKDTIAKATKEFLEEKYKKESKVEKD